MMLRRIGALAFLVALAAGAVAGGVIAAGAIDGRTRAEFQAISGHLGSPLAKKAAEVLASRPAFDAHQLSRRRSGHNRVQLRGSAASATLSPREFCPAALPDLTSRVTPFASL